MIFYFIAMRPHLEKAISDRIYLSLEDAEEALEFINGLVPPYSWMIYQAEAMNISIPAVYMQDVGKLLLVGSELLQPEDAP